MPPPRSWPIAGSLICRRITFANPVVAVALGAVFLDELITTTTVIGFVLVVAGCWFATRPPPALTERARNALDEASGNGLLAPAIHVDLPHTG